MLKVYPIKNINIVYPAFISIEDMAHKILSIARGKNHLHGPIRVWKVELDGWVGVGRGFPFLCISSISEGKLEVVSSFPPVMISHPKLIFRPSISP